MTSTTTNVVWCDPGRATATPLNVKSRQQAMWASGDFAVVGTTLQIVGETLCETLDVRSNNLVLDVAAGNGNATLAAARRFAHVISTDYVPDLLAKGKRRAEAEGLDVIFEVADAEALPYADQSFDVVLSTFGVMFAPDHAQAAREMLRVVRRGGRIGLACWTPGGFVGQLLKVVGAHVAPIPGVASPMLWGRFDHLDDLFAEAASVSHAVKSFAFRYVSAEHFIEVFRSYYGPVHKAFASLDSAGQEALETDLLSLLRRLDQGDASGLVIPGEYLEIVVVK